MRGLVTVVAVGDQELGVGELGGDGAMGLGVGDPPDPMNGALVVGDLGPGVGAGVALEVPPGVARVQREDRREVVPGRLGEPQAILLRARLGALVRPDEAGAVLGDPDAAEQSAPHPPRAVGGGVLLGQRPDRRLAVGSEDPLQRPFLERLGRVLVGIAARGRLGEVELDDVERRAPRAARRRRSASITS